MPLVHYEDRRVTSIHLNFNCVFVIDNNIFNGIDIDPFFYECQEVT